MRVYAFDGSYTEIVNDKSFGWFLDDSDEENLILQESILVLRKYFTKIHGCKNNASPIFITQKIVEERPLSVIKTTRKCEYAAYIKETNDRLVTSGSETKDAHFRYVHEAFPFGDEKWPILISSKSPESILLLQALSGSNFARRDSDSSRAKRNFESEEPHLSRALLARSSSRSSDGRVTDDSPVIGPDKIITTSSDATTRRDNNECLPPSDHNYNNDYLQHKQRQNSTTKTDIINQIKTMLEETKTSFKDLQLRVCMFEKQYLNYKRERIEESRQDDVILLLDGKIDEINFRKWGFLVKNTNKLEANLFI